MNTDQAREKLLDLVYGELDDAERQAVLRLVHGSPELQTELAGLRQARAALAQYRAGEPAAPPAVSTRPTGIEAAGKWPRRRPAHLFRWLSPLAAAAAAIILGVVIWTLTGPGTTTVIAQGDPVEIKRTDVSVTILSSPEDQPPAPMYQPQQALVQRRSYQTYQTKGDLGAWGPRGQWRGLALVRDQRLIRNLPKGATEVRFTDVPTGILPDTVRFRSVDDPDDLTILEQNYQYDLATVDKLLERYVDKPIAITFKDGKGIRGELLSFDGQNLVVRPKGEGPRNVTRQEVRSVAFPELPEGLLTRPTLLWVLDNQAGLNQRLEVAYMTAGLTWRADYVLKLRPADKPAVAKDKKGNPQIFDTAELVGYATVTNNSGVTYQNAQLKLMAGDLNLIRPPQQHYLYNNLGGIAPDEAAAAPQFKEKSFFEYHLYTLGRPTTLASAETKQIELISGSGIRLLRAYVYDRNVNRTAARVVSEMVNSEKNGLGKPLPKGVVRLYAPDPDGLQTYVAKTTIDHTPKDEKIRLPWSFAFDIACSARQTESKVRGGERYARWRYSLRNHKDYDVTVTVIVHVPRTAYQAECTLIGADRHRWHIRQVGLIEIDVPVKSNTSAAVDFAYHYNINRGGGLKSPYDQKKPD